jgi:hypothetical protein
MHPVYSNLPKKNTGQGAFDYENLRVEEAIYQILILSSSFTKLLEVYFFSFYKKI